MKNTVIILEFITIFGFFTGCKNVFIAGENDAVTRKSSDKIAILVYMAADNDLESYALQNLKQMERANNKKITTLVLLDRAEEYDQTNGDWTDTRLFEVKHDNTNSAVLVSKRLECPELGLDTENSTELDMGNPNVLRKFIEFAQRKYSANKYVLILWGHGTGWRIENEIPGRAVAIDDTTDSYMSVKDLGIALKDKQLDVIGFDTCFGGVFENVYELKDCCKYIVASPDVTPSIGWNYTQLLESFLQCDFDDLALSQNMAESSSVQTTILNTEKIDDLMIAFENFAKELSGSITSYSEREEVFNQLFSIKSYCYSQYPCDMYLDMFEMAEFYKSSENLELSNRALTLQKKLESAGETQNCKNIQIGVHFIPKTSAQTIATQHSDDYIKTSENTTQCAFIKESRWWVPTKTGNSGSLLDKLFYSTF